MRPLVVRLQESYWESERRAVKALGAHRSVTRYRPKRPALDAPVRKRMGRIAAVRFATAIGRFTSFYNSAKAGLVSGVLGLVPAFRVGRLKPVQALRESV